MTTKQKLDDIVQRAYDIFAPYIVQHPIHGSPISVTKQMQEKLATVLMRDATGDHLYRYLFKAMTTWGTDTDFKHYLPRFMELIVLDFQSLVWGEMVFKKLAYAQYEKWSLEEVQIIGEFIDTLWLYILEEYPSRTISHSDFFSGFDGNVSRFIPIWESQLNKKSAILHLADYINHEFNFVSYGKDVTKSNTPELQWVKKPQFKQKIESLYFEMIDSEYSDMLSYASQNLQWINDYGHHHDLEGDTHD
jgi:hypothetical protein